MTHSCYIRNRSSDKICDSISYQEAFIIQIFIPPALTETRIILMDTFSKHTIFHRQAKCDLAYQHQVGLVVNL